MLARRLPWPSYFPLVAVHTTVGNRDSHPDYAAAKAGSRGAAVRLALDLLSVPAAAILRQELAGRQPTLVPVRAIEAAGMNLIPAAMAEELARLLGLQIATDILQTNTVGHTRANGYKRLALQPTFAGEVEIGREYVLVDDHIGLGGTLANLRGHIEGAGGRVIAATTMSASRNSEALALREETLQSLRRRHGQALESYWHTEFGFGLACLTQAEAGYLLRTSSVDDIRAGVASARGA